MIKLIASDVDGTLVPEGTSQVDPHLFECILKLKEKGIRFVAASGRQYAGVLSIFRPVKDDILFIADNGAYIIEHDRFLFSNTIPPADWHEIVRFLRTLPEVYIMLSTVEGTFSETPEAPFLDMVVNGYGIPLHQVEDLTALELAVSKVAVYCPLKNPAEIARTGRERFGNTANIVVSGECWMDFMSPSADKGNALRRIQDYFGILPEETMAFGDNSNDIGLLNRAGSSYAVSGARPDVKAAARHVLAEGMEDNAVQHVLEELLRSSDADF